MKYCKPYILIFSLITILISCQSPKIDLSSYYFPVEQFNPGKIYIYSSDNPKEPDMFWYLSLVKTGDSIFLATQQLDTSLNVEQFALERKVGSGMVLYQGFIYQQDSNGKRQQWPMEVVEKSVFPFQVKDTTGIFLYKIKIATEGDDNYIRITRNRRFIGFEKINFEGKEVDCAKMEIKELIEDHNNGTIESNTLGTEYYAKDIGLIYSRKSIDEKFVIGYRLKGILSLEDFEIKYKKRFELRNE